MNKLNTIDFTVEEKKFICAIINKFGIDDHPYCDEDTFNYFTVDYLLKLINSINFKTTSLTNLGEELIVSIESKLPSN